MLKYGMLNNGSNMAQQMAGESRHVLKHYCSKGYFTAYSYS